MSGCQRRYFLALQRFRRNKSQQNRNRKWQRRSTSEKLDSITIIFFCSWMKKNLPPKEIFRSFYSKIKQNLRCFDVKKSAAWLDGMFPFPGSRWSFEIGVFNFVKKDNLMKLGKHFKAAERWEKERKKTNFLPPKGLRNKKRTKKQQQQQSTQIPRNLLELEKLIFGFKIESVEGVSSQAAGLKS